MEISYVIIPLVESNENAFNLELKKLFPFGIMKKLLVEGQLLLAIYFDIDYLLDSQTCSEGELYLIDEIVQGFGRKHPYLKVLNLHITCGGDICFYEGYVLKNRNKYLKNSGLDNAFLPLVQELIPSFEERSFEPFLSSFINEIEPE